MSRVAYTMVVVGFIVGSASLVAAQGTEGVDVGVPTDVTADKVLTEKKDKPTGFVPKLTFGVTGAFNDSRKVIGTDDGSTVQVGLMLDGSANYYHGQSDWENELKLNEAYSRTPQIPKFVKSADTLELKSTYLYRLPSLTWFGPYGRARLTTQLFKGYEVRADDVTILRPNRPPAVKRAGTSIALTGAFEPSLIRESVGAFANPLSEKSLTANAKVGVGMQHLLTSGGFSLADDDATPEIEYAELASQTQGGGELDLSLKGEIADNVTWEGGAQYFLPFYSTLEDAPTGIDALNQEYELKLSLKLNAWASLDYKLSVKRLPLIVDEWQVQNGLMLKAGFDLI